MTGWRARLLARRGLRRGIHTRDFSVTDLVDAVHGDHGENVYLDIDVWGQLAARGGGARAAVSARLAPAPPLATALLGLRPSGALSLRPFPDPRLRLRLETDVAPLQELLLWFDDHALAQIDMPFLTLRNITGKRNYACHECGVEFEHPNSLKIHLFLACRPFEPSRFWAQVCHRLRGAAPTVTPTPAPTALPSPERVEALAAAWGRSRAGHVCVYCGKLYSRKYGLKIHIRTHTGYKPLRCRHCARAFGDPSNLNKHVRLHAAGGAAGAGAGPAYACALCGRRLARRRDLQRHLRSHHAHALIDLAPQST